MRFLTFYKTRFRLLFFGFYIVPVLLIWLFFFWPFVPFSLVPLFDAVSFFVFLFGRLAKFFCSCLLGWAQYLDELCSSYGGHVHSKFLLAARIVTNKCFYIALGSHDHGVKYMASNWN